MALHSYCGVERIRIEADSAKPANPRHVARLEYRLSHFRKLFLMMEIGDGLSETPLAEFQGRLVLNQPRAENQYVVTDEEADAKRAAKANVNDRESDPERALEVRPR